MEFFELTAADITSLDDGQLRELVARLAEAELVEQGIARSSVQAGGAQEAADGGLDVSVAATKALTCPNFVPRASTGFQVKKHSIGRSGCKKEMLDDDGLKASIAALAKAGGAYIIVSGKDNCSALMLAERIAGMKEALEGDANRDALHVDFYGADRMALWLKIHPGVALWAREKLGKPLAGWRPYGRWAATPTTDDDEFLADSHPCVIDSSSSDKSAKTVLEGIQLARDRLRSGIKAVRITGLSGVGKTRFAQALFEEGVGQNALPATDVVYADLGEALSPSASTVVTWLIANKLPSYIVLDNCPSDAHRALQKQLSASTAPLRLLTVEYDISDDRPEETDVIHIEPGSEETVAKLLLRRYKNLNRFNAIRIAEFAGGNARLALVLADRVDADETLASFTDEQLFQRLFSQRKGESADLFRGATVLSLVYSFNISRSAHGDELGVLSAISELPRSTLNRDQAELLRRQLAQRRGDWRAVLPHALAARLARRALEEYSPEDINRELFKPANIRLLQSCAHRLGYLHDSDRARELALTWAAPGGPLADLAACDEGHLVVLDRVAPVSPDVILHAIEQAARTAGFADRANPHVHRFVKLLADLAYEDVMFDRAAAILLTIARTERHRENNNSVVGRLRQLLSLRLSGTMAAPERRQVFVQKLLASGNPRDREIAGELLNAAFEARSWTAFGGFHFGARKRGGGWQPGSAADVRAWYEGFLKLLEPLLDGGGEPSEWAKSLVAANFRQLWTSAGCVDALERLVSRHGAGGGWPAVWLSIDQTLDYDGSGMKPAKRHRLEALQSRAAPTDLESEIRAYAFVDEWSRPRQKGMDYQEQSVQLRDRVRALGSTLWSAHGLFERLAPQIWSTRVNPVAWLGEGFAAGAAGATDALLDRTIVAFDAHAPGRASVAFLEGALNAIATSTPDRLPEALERLLEAPKMAPHAVWILIATPITPWVAHRLIEVARTGDVPAGHFESVGHGRRHQSMSDADFAALANAVSTLPHGYNSALDMLVMRLHDRREWDYTPGPEIYAAIRTAVGRLLNETEKSSTGSVGHGVGALLVEALGPASPEEVGALLKALCAGLREFRLSWTDMAAVVSAFVQARPEMLLDALFVDAERDDDLIHWMFRQRFGNSTPSLNLAPVERLLAWCAADADRFGFVARNIRVFEPTTPSADEDEDAPSPARLSEPFKRFLAAAPDKVALIEVAFEQAVPTSWMNSRVPIMQARQDALRELLSHPLPDVRALVAEKLAELDGHIAHERNRDEADHHGREQRFE